MLESDTEITQKMVGLGLLIENPEQQVMVTEIKKSLPPKVGSLMKVQIHGIVHGDDGLQLKVCRVEVDPEWKSLMTEMGEFYNDHRSELKPIQRMGPGYGLYAALIDSTWYRVYLLGCGHSIGGNVNVLLDDYGRVRDIPFSHIYPLDIRFSSAPRQGMLCSLYGLQHFPDHYISREDGIKMCERIFDAFVVSSEPLTLVLYDSEKGSDLSEYLLSQVNMCECGHVHERQPLPRPGGPIDKVLVTVSYVSPTCDNIYLRRRTQQTALVDALVSLASLRAASGTLPSAKNLCQHGIYLGLSDQHGWCRMTPLSTVPAVDGSVPVMMIDHGDVDSVSVKSLRALEGVITELSGQAVRVSLARVPPSSTKTFSAQAAKKMRELLPPNLNLQLRVVDVSKSGLPVVELFECTNSSNAAMVNASLQLDETLYNESTEKSAGIIPSPTPEEVMVPKAQLASISSTFDVKE